MLNMFWQTLSTADKEMKSENSQWMVIFWSFKQCDSNVKNKMSNKCHWPFIKIIKKKENASWIGTCETECMFQLELVWPSG